ncbi:MAG: Bax inhibitor-1/YccA family protein [Burkholderiales bacterium]|nr:Bax inhibitor-1/YccA family protein [Burkholderiales bacterium]
MQPNTQPRTDGFRQPVPSQGVALQQLKVLRNTYLLLALTLIPTAIGAFIGLNLNFGILRANPIVSSLVILAVVYGMFFAIEKNRDSGLGVVLLLALTLFLGVILGPLLQVALGLRNGAQLVAMAAGGTAVVFFSMAAIGTTTKRNLSFMGSFLAVGVIVVMLGVLANIFFQSPAVQLTICAVFVLLCSMLIVFQINQIVQGGETNYVSATLTLYMSIYNLFSSLLQILMMLTGQRE